jgi:hypothetical protein
MMPLVRLPGHLRCCELGKRDTLPILLAPRAFGAKLIHAQHRSPVRGSSGEIRLRQPKHYVARTQYTLWCCSCSGYRIPSPSASARGEAWVYKSRRDRQASLLLYIDGLHWRIAIVPKPTNNCVVLLRKSHIIGFNTRRHFLSLDANSPACNSG